MNDTVITENIIPEGYVEARKKFDPNTEVLLRVEDLKDGMVVLIESMPGWEDPAKAEDPDCDSYTLERLNQYQTWRRVSDLQKSTRHPGIIGWLGTDAKDRTRSQKYGVGHFFFVKKSSMPEAYPQPYMTALQDLAKIIAQETSGLTGAIPEQADYDLAMKFRQQIEEAS